MEQQVLEKIRSNPDTYIIFYTDDCYYSQKALGLLKESGVKYKGYDINKIGGLDVLLNILNKNHLLDKYNQAHSVRHSTRPCVFYNGQFIGGYTDLQKIIKKN